MEEKYIQSNNEEVINCKSKVDKFIENHLKTKNELNHQLNHQFNLWEDLEEIVSLQISEEKSNYTDLIFKHQNFNNELILYLNNENCKLKFDNEMTNYILSNLIFENILDLIKMLKLKINTSLLLFLEYFIYQKTPTNLNQERLNFIVNISLKYKSSLINTLIYSLLKSKNEDGLKCLKKILDENSNQILKDKEKHFNNNIQIDSITDKIHNFLEENKESFTNYTSFRNFLKIKQNKLEILESHVNLKSEILSTLEKETKKKEIFNDTLNLIKVLKKLDNEDFPVNVKVELFFNIEEFLKKMKNEFENKEFSNIKSFLMNKKVILYEKIKVNTQKLIEENFFKFSDKSITFNLKNIKLEGIIYPLNFIISKFPELIINILQALFNNFIIYFKNKNFYLTKKLPAENEVTFQFELNLEENQTNTEKDLKQAENFEYFVEVLAKFKLILENLSQSTNFKKLIQSDALIEFDILYAGHLKKTHNNFIFVLAYYITLFYKNIKETLLDSYSNSKAYDDYSILFIINSAWESYKKTTNSYSALFETISNFKFYGSEDFIFNQKRSRKNSFDKKDAEFQNKIILLRNYIKNSHEDTKNLKYAQITLTKLINEIFSLNLDENEIKSINSDELIKLNMNFNNKIIVSNNFANFIKEFLSLLKVKDNKEAQVVQNKLSKILSLFYTMYNSYLRLNENSPEKVSEILLLHNNIESFLFCLQFSMMFNKSEKMVKEDFLKKTVVFFKNFSSNIINQVISFFIRDLIGILSVVESFEGIKYERNLTNTNRVISNCTDLILSFFSIYSKYSNETNIFYYLNYVLSLFFDLLNRKILLVKDFDVDDTKVLLKLSKFITDEIKNKLGKLLNDMSGVNNLLENNTKYKKFEEILFMLNSNMKEIREFLINSGFKIHIDALELVELIKSIFEDNQNRKSLVDFVNEKLLNS